MSVGQLLRRVESASAAGMVVDGRPLLSFGGSSYLGLGGHPGIVDAGVDALRRLGASAQLSRHYGFGLSANLDAETAAREFFETDGAMYFGTGYLFGLIAISGLATQCDAVFLDEHAHYSLRDAAMASGLPTHVFAHGDAQDLARVMARQIAPGARPLVATDGMFPTRGRIAPLNAYAALLAPHDGWLVVDESHAFGCVGRRGRGAVELADLPRDRVLAGGSMGKAIGAHGGLAIGSASLIEQLWRTPAARGAVLGCSAGAAMTAAGLRHVDAHPELLERLRHNVRAVRQGLRELGLRPEAHEGPLATFEHGRAADMARIQRSLMARGIFIAHSTYVGAGDEGVLRVAVFADHTEDDIHRLLDELRPLL
ncbi:pyridoxal phosphate-dependent aminotransferase family protein [Mitsuaria sp. GD03876]|uniref:aminotransferase class I/II-fold pyridoxal phosphate-dependent enzyme n=1 Tax=Mitsuaria sp. GD03876 TaxID=2975399 RepID=UPI00244A23F4|nr:pyridoxal phosphate-dependent aminotransferase family protein [Mitsuaria sp. GD03876]MDH0864723.1 pyridoxal phosphate-dependent aminotransferase family protein [Mitsuaria sp. GD03876]